MAFNSVLHGRLNATNENQTVTLETACDEASQSPFSKWWWNNNLNKINALVHGPGLVLKSKCAIRLCRLFCLLLILLDWAFLIYNHGWGVLGMVKYYT